MLYAILSLSRRIQNTVFIYTLPALRTSHCDVEFKRTHVIYIVSLYIHTDAPGSTDDTLTHVSSIRLDCRF